MDVDSEAKMKKSPVGFWVIGILIIPVVCLIIYTWITLSWSFSKGERTGYVQKLSKSGWVCKTWEGEMAMVTMPGAIPEKFYFSIRDDQVAERVNKFAGKRVALVYEQHRGVPTRCFGDTDYYVVDVKAID
ncbi:MAG: hypothetical protein NTZ57_03970 [Deltaproteobacteria bacterium]|jgi:hypothetical protein|nr:hypothetical protein [Deltaproteobacteria bacterium]